MKKLSLLLLMASLFFLYSDKLYAVEKLDVKVDVILASSEGNDVDASLKEIKSKLQRMFKFSSYKLLKSEGFIINPGESFAMNIAGNIKMTVEHRYFSENFAVLKAKVSNPIRLFADTQFRLRKRKSFYIGGISYNSKVIIIRIKVSW